MTNARANFAFLPPLSNHERIYANHRLYNELIEFLENRRLSKENKQATITGRW